MGHHMKKAYPIKTDDLLRILDILDDIQISATLFKEEPAKGKTYRVYLPEKDIKAMKDFLGKYKWIMNRSFEEYFDKHLWFVSMIDKKDKELQKLHYNVLSKIYPLWGNALLTRKLSRKRRKTLEKAYREGEKLWEKYCTQAEKKYMSFLRRWMKSKRIKFTEKKREKPFRRVFYIEDEKHGISSVWIGRASYVEPVMIHALISIGRFKKDLAKLANATDKISILRLGKTEEEVWLRKKILSTGDCELFLTVLFAPTRIQDPYALV